jgi:hypothetical protein
MWTEAKIGAAEARKSAQTSQAAAKVWWLAAFAAVLVGFTLHAVYLNVPAEDSFITFRFARNLANGNGLVWNIGEAPVEGYTNFLWLLLSALLIKLNLDVVFWTQLLGVMVSLASFYIFARFALDIFDLSRPVVLVAGLFLAASGPFATWAASSMETNLFALLVLLACYTFARWIRHNRTRDILFSQITLFLASLTRPEGVLVFAVLAALGFIFSLPRARALPLWKYLASLMVFGLPFLVYFLWRYQVFGYLLPNTFYAKTGGGLPQILRGAKYSILFGLLFGLPLAPVILASIWEKEWRISWPEFRSTAQWLRLARRYAGLLVCSLVSAAYTLYIVAVGGDYMAMFRFFVPVLPLIYLIYAQFVEWLFADRFLSVQKRRFAAGLVCLGIAATLLQSTPLEEKIFGKPWFMHGTYRGVQHERWHVARNTLVGKFFRDYKHSEDESLALLGIGIIPYVTNMKIGSFHGIVDPYIAHKATGLPIGSWVAGHEKIDFVSVILKKPDYIMVDTGDLYPEPQPFPDYPDEIDAFVRENYTLKSVWLNDTVNRESGYLTFLELKDSPGLDEANEAGDQGIQ